MFDPVAFHVFGWPIRWYGITMALSLLIATYLGQRLLESRGRKGEYVWDGVLWAAIFGIIGARAVYVLTNLGDYTNFIDIFKTYEGGLSFHGGIAFGLLGCWLYYRRTPLKLYEVMDAMAPGIAIGIMLVRFIGNLSNGDILGYKVSREVVPWAMNFPFDEYHLAANDTAAIITRHPAEIYGGLVGLVVLAITAYIWRRRFAPGTNMYAFIAGYSLVRSLIEEPFRDVPHYLVSFYNEAWGIGGITLTQWSSVVFIIIGVWGIIAVNRRAGAEAWDPPPPEPEPETERPKARRARKPRAKKSPADKKHKPFKK